MWQFCNKLAYMCSRMCRSNIRYSECNNRIRLRINNFEMEELTFTPKV